MSSAAEEKNWLIVRPRYSVAVKALASDREAEQLPFDYSIYQLTSGSAELIIDEAARPVKAGDFVFIQPGRAYRLCARSEASLACGVSLKNDYIVELAAEMALDRGEEIFFLHEYVASAPELAALFQALQSEAEAVRAGRQLVIEAIITQIAIHLLRSHMGIRRNPQLELSRVGLVDRRLRRAIEYMHAHYDRELELAEIAQSAFLSEYHFARLFKRLTGLTPHHYLAAVRIEEAKRMLAETDLGIATISSAVGYASQSHFTKIFRVITGLTPARYRDRLIKS